MQLGLWAVYHYSDIKLAATGAWPAEQQHDCCCSYNMSTPPSQQKKQQHGRCCFRDTNARGLATAPTPLPLSRVKRTGWRGGNTIRFLLSLDPSHTPFSRLCLWPTLLSVHYVSALVPQRCHLSIPTCPPPLPPLPIRHSPHSPKADTNCEERTQM
ncbi:hypothetical protein GALMADRAFT_136993 [Galerina marginata CBS 339.88]|uniref:Uncharacterized protein n=1 Tax=Galerina marginata (strain CBS 339.88) TaxID=685588 RepID=A0A067TGQ9_GALM3|nr:hypothetical protein GALMADRAFT_136993 [Galerina marginata CBS 339.88]